MTRHCVTTLCVALLVFAVAGFASATTFNVANYTCTDLYGVARTYNTSNLEPNFMAFDLTDSGTISGVGVYANLGGGGVPIINTRMALQCGPAGFGPMSFSGTYGSVGSPPVSNNGNYTNAGVPTSGHNYNTGVAFNNDRQATFGGNDSGVLTFAGSGANDYGGAYWNGSAHYPAAISTRLVHVDQQ